MKHALSGLEALRNGRVMRAPTGGHAKRATNTFRAPSHTKPGLRFPKLQPTKLVRGIHIPRRGSPTTTTTLLLLLLLLRNHTPMHRSVFPTTNAATTTTTQIHTHRPARRREIKPIRMRHR